DWFVEGAEQRVRLCWPFGSCADKVHTFSAWAAIREQSRKAPGRWQALGTGGLDNAAVCLSEWGCERETKRGVSWQGWGLGGAGLSVLATVCLMPVEVSSDMPNKECHGMSP
ncbi:hypothetical protein SORBI_3008G042400, partial [Sorghum bicolor]